MFYRTKRHYEVLAYRNPDGEPYPMEQTTRKADALRIGKAWAKLYDYVEVNAVYTNADDATDVQGTTLIWSNATEQETTK